MLKNRKTRTAAGLVVALAVLVALSLPTAGAAKEHEEMAPKGNHFKCYQVLDWTVWEPVKAELKDQFGASVAKLYEPYMLCNPVDKNGEGIPAPKYHLVCYKMEDDPQGATERVKEVTIKNQFQEGPLWVGSAPMICLPSMKQYQPRG